MTRDDLKKIDALPDEQLAALGVYETAAVEKMVAQVNDAHAAVEGLEKAQVEALAAKDTAHKEELAKAVNAATAPLQEQLQAASGQLATLESEAKEYQQLCDAMGGTEMGQKLRREQQRAQLEAAKEAARATIADADAKIAELQAS